MTQARRIAFVTPHPPILVPEVGRGREAEISATAGAMTKLAEEVRADPPDAFVLMSPHAPTIGRQVAVLAGESYRGSLYQFGASEVALAPLCDHPLAEAIDREAGTDTLLVETSRVAPLDHGAIVPLSFLDPKSEIPLVLLSIAMSGMATFERIGAAIGRAVGPPLDRRIVFVASGDLSHRLTPDAPAGYVADAKNFDSEIAGILKAGNLDKLADLDPELVDRAAECGLRSIYAAAGYMGRPDPSRHEVLSYEGPFGVGYLVGRLEA
jgi:MEMO1 family protein